MDTPVGIAWRNGYVRCCNDCFDKPYLISEMKRSPNNIKPVIVVDITTKKSKCYFINATSTDFDEKTGFEAEYLCRRVEGIADYMINKKNIQKSNLTVKEKDECCELNETKHFHKQKLPNKIFESLLTKANLTESK